MKYNNRGLQISSKTVCSDHTFTVDSWRENLHRVVVCLVGCRGLLAMGNNPGPMLVQAKGFSTTHRPKMSGTSSSDLVIYLLYYFVNLYSYSRSECTWFEDVK